MSKLPSGSRCVVVKDPKGQSSPRSDSLGRQDIDHEVELDLPANRNLRERVKFEVTSLSLTILHILGMTVHIAIATNFSGFRTITLFICLSMNPIFTVRLRSPPNNISIPSLVHCYILSFVISLPELKSFPRLPRLNWFERRWYGVRQGSLCNVC
jgi:hypothetical protein